MDKKKEPTKWQLQGPKIQEDFGNQTYYAICEKYAINAIGFIYPSSKHSTQEQQENMERIIHCVNNFEPSVRELLNELETVVKEYEMGMKTMSQVVGINYSENNVAISAKRIIAKNKKLLP